MTTREAIAGLVRALERIGNAPDAAAFEAGGITRAALASWNAREPLRDNADLAFTVRM